MAAAAVAAAVVGVLVAPGGHATVGGCGHENPSGDAAAGGCDVNQPRDDGTTQTDVRAQPFPDGASGVQSLMVTVE